MTKSRCPNGCKIALLRRTIQRNEDGTYKFARLDFLYCPHCGCLMQSTQKKIKDFFELLHVHEELKRAVGLIYKSEFEAAAREAFVSVENTLRKKSGLDLHGIDLATKSLQFEYDKKANQMVKSPLVAVNDMKTESDRNEQEGVRYMLMGFFHGPRNIYQHRHIGSPADYAITIVIQASFFLKLLDGQSILKNAHWVKSSVKPSDIYYNMPNVFDRIRFIEMLHKSYKYKKKIEYHKQANKES